MNTSYKIALLTAFALFVAVVGYFIFSGDPATDEPPVQGPLASDTPEPEATPPARPKLVLPPKPTPDREMTIDVPAIDDSGLDFERLVGGDPVTDNTDTGTPGGPDEGVRNGPGSGDTPRGDAPTGDDTTDEPTTDTTDEPRTGPGTTGGDRVTETPDPTDPTDPTGGTGWGEETPRAPIREITPEPRRPIPPAPRSTPRSYTVQAGDTFASIAEDIYGEERAWFEIAQANPSIDPKQLQVGQVIVLPDRNAIENEREEVQPPAPGNDQSYTVRPGDNLSSIAKKFYNDTEAWDLIYARNRDKIGASPDQLKAGMVLIIPQSYNGAE